MKILLIILVISSVLAQQKYQDADKVSAESLKTLNLSITETVFSGYLPVNTDKTAQFHYFFVLTDVFLPITLWLNGGPGCSSAEGMWTENGPTNFAFQSTTPKRNPHTWAQASNMLYLESPIGVGFSYGPSQDQTDESTAKYNLQALISFFTRFNQFTNSEFYISGESYAGIYIPTLANQIIDYNTKNPTIKINLKGLMIGNGCTHPTECTSAAETFPQHFINYIGQHNLISPATHQAAMNNVEKCYGFPSDECNQILADAESQFTNKMNINPYNVYGPCAMETFEVNGELMTRRQSSSSRNLFSRNVKENVLGACDDSIGIYTLLRNKDFLKAFHINTSKTPKWDVCADINYSVDDKASYYLYPKLIQSGLRIWKYSGDIDSVVPITGTLWWINKLQNEYNLRTLVEFRPWFVDGLLDKQRQNAGNFWRLNGLTFVSIRDAGHMVPTDKGGEALFLFQSFLSNSDLPSE